MLRATINFIRTIILWLSTLISVVLLAFLSFFFKKNQRAYQAWISFFAGLILSFAWIKVEVYGLENLPSGGCLLAANHSTFLDNLILLAKLPPFKFVADVSGFKLPLLKNLYQTAGYLQSRQKGLEAAQSLKLYRSLKRGERIVIYSHIPKSGELGEFSQNLVELSKASGLPIAPVCIIGSRKVLPLLPQKGWPFPALDGCQANLKIGRPLINADLQTLHSRMQNLYML